MTRGRKKQTDNLIENGLKTTHIVQKSNPLFSLWKSNLTLAEFKILDTYLSRINSREPDKRSVVFEKGKLEELLGVKKINLPVLDERLKNIQSTLVNIGVDDKIDRITLFERSQAEQDEYGIWKVTLTCTPSAMKYIFNIEELGYLRYQIRSIINITSIYSYIMFTYLEYNRFRKSWEIELDDLKDILNCTADTYREYKRFNDLILKKCKTELTEKTDLRYEYEPIRKGRRVFAIKFTVKNMKKSTKHSILPKQDDIQPHIDTHNLLSEAVNYEFSVAQIEDLFSIICTMNIAMVDSSIDIGRYHYLREKYAALNVAAEKSFQIGKPIKNRFAYLKKMIISDNA